VLDIDHIREKGYDVIEGDILRVDGQVRHDSELLARLIFDHYFKVAKTAKVKV
jgi:hypothetical protein